MATITKICTNVTSSLVHTRPSPVFSFFSLKKNEILHYDIRLLIVFYTFKKNKTIARFKKNVSARSIFSAEGFVGEVVTHFLADSDFHGHRPDVLIPPPLFDG